ncbi:maltose/maltodextrin ABC transporter substrate-binding protein MalE [Pseudomonas sp. MIL19]|uniref:maltose/maltodextrin ABC transporter substrate-binding protein MalE n=1 Tax=Pseudomonas sp. MIL19 TaxID=2976979 RepID=UPI002363CFAB|nr:maltose/maltodextrin ABC transporter substrate-binding protein MalE [Pseudomonas sp. MIL19]MDD2160521.1 maltose/maltodextrin ABC transporter substrate-binding protein MalE [Pseudomonas sp. MIL19]
MKTTIILALLLLMPVLLPSVHGFEKGTLTIWINPDKGHDGLRQVGERFTRDTGMPVKVLAPEDLASRFDRLGATAQGPDIVIFAHDRFGSWINAGLLQPLVPTAAALQRAPTFAWEALRVGADFYGYPLAVETISLIYNQQLVTQPPRDLEQLAALDRQLRAQGKRAIAWDYRNLYFSWPFINAGGAYSIGKHGGLYDLGDLGIAGPAAIAGVQSIKALLDSGVLAHDSDYGSMMEDFKRGEVAMIVNGPWAWNELRDARIPIALAAVPGPSAEQPGRPFIGVQAAALNRHSRHKAQAQRFIEDYLSSAEGLRTIDADKPLGAPANLELMAQMQDDPLIAATYQAAERGEIMPDIPEMKRFWSLFEARLEPMLLGQRPIPETLAEIARRLHAAGRMQGQRRLHYPSADGS